MTNIEIIESLKRDLKFVQGEQKKWEKDSRPGASAVSMFFRGKAEGLVIALDLLTENEER